MPSRPDKLAASILICITTIFLLYILWKRHTQPPITIDLVVARYKESLDWLHAYNTYPFRRIYIYNKSEEPIQCPISNAECHIESLPNVGMCDHTYLYHILKTYADPTSADITIFLPASAGSNDMKRPKVVKVFKMAREGNASMSGYIPTNIQDDKIGGPGFYLGEWKVSDKKNSDGPDFQLVKASPRPFGKWYEKYFPGEKLERISLVGIFAVTRDMIHSNPIGKYQSLIETIDRDKYSEAAHYIERSWATLFKDISSRNLV